MSFCFVFFLVKEKIYIKVVLINLLLPLARNISATEESLAADELAGQMTTQSLGFAAN